MAIKDISRAEFVHLLPLHPAPERKANRLAVLTVMGVEPISAREFGRLVPSHSIMESLIGKGLEWFANDSKRLIGTIAQNDTNKKWGYVIWGRDDSKKDSDFVWGQDDRGNHRSLDLKANFEIRQTAKSRLLVAMQEMEQRGDWRLFVVPCKPSKRAGKTLAHK